MALQLADALKNFKLEEEKPKQTKVQTKSTTKNDEKSKQKMTNLKRQSKNRKNNRKKLVSIKVKDFELTTNDHTRQREIAENLFKNHHGYSESRRDLAFERRTIEGYRQALVSKLKDHHPKMDKLEDGTINLTYTYNYKGTGHKTANLIFDKQFSFAVWLTRRIEHTQCLIDEIKKQKGDTKAYISVIKSMLGILKSLG